MDLNKPWKNYTFVAFDTETSGGYPLGSDIVEFAAVKWHDGKNVDSIQFLLKPRERMSDFIIGIHGITNEMVEHAAQMNEKIKEIYHFFQGCVLVAHHAPFDIGFLVVEFEKEKLPLPHDPVLCSSLLSRKLIPASKDHKLQTLISFLNIHQGVAHRALDDSKACLEVAFKCFEKLKPDATIAEIMKIQHKNLSWENFSIEKLKQQNRFSEVANAIEKKWDVDIVYDGGTHKGKTRRITPIGIVRNPDGDYVQAYCHIDKSVKRFYTAKISDAMMVMK